MLKLVFRKVAISLRIGPEQARGLTSQSLVSKSLRLADCREITARRVLEKFQRVLIPSSRELHALAEVTT